jgi:hypothetical protein
LLRIVRNSRSALARGTNQIFHDVIQNEIYTWSVDARNRALGVVDATVEHYNDVLVRIYHSAKTVFATSLPDYDATWTSDLGDQILDAHKASGAQVTRIFVFQNMKQIMDSHRKIMETQRADGIKVRVFISEQNRGVFEPDVSKDFTVIDAGKVIGLTQTYGPRNLSAKWHFEDTELAGRMQAICGVLERRSKPLQEI